MFIDILIDDRHGTDIQSTNQNIRSLSPRFGILCHLGSPNLVNDGRRKSGISGRTNSHPTRPYKRYSPDHIQAVQICLRRR